MKLKLTPHQLVYLGFDGPQDCPLIRAIVAKTRRGDTDLSPEEITRLRREIRGMPTFGSTPAAHRAARTLNDKLDDLE